MNLKNLLLNKLITVDPNIRDGTPCFKNTRIPVSYVLKHFKLGWNIDEIVKLFPELSKSKISQVLSYFDHLVEYDKEKINKWRVNP